MRGESKACGGGGVREMRGESKACGGGGVGWSEVSKGK